jgi:hypothetical protein
MKKVIKIYLERLRNEAHFQFFAEFLILLNKFIFVKEKLETLVIILIELFAREDEVVDYIRKSDYSAKIVAADRRLNKALVGFNDIVRGATHHANQTIADAAISLYNLIKSYKNIMKKTYYEKIASVTNLLQDLDGSYKIKTGLISGLDDYIMEIALAKSILMTLLEERDSEKSGKPKERMIAVRREIDAAYREFITHLEAYRIVEGDANYDGFVRELNVLVERFNHLHPHKSDKKDDETDIPEDGDE